MQIKLVVVVVVCCCCIRDNNTVELTRLEQPNFQIEINKLTSVFYASVLLLMINFVITLAVL